MIPRAQKKGPIKTLFEPLGHERLESLTRALQESEEGVVDASASAEGGFGAGQVGDRCPEPRIATGEFPRQVLVSGHEAPYARFVHPRSVVECAAKLGQDLLACGAVGDNALRSQLLTTPLEVVALLSGEVAPAEADVLHQPRQVVAPGLGIAAEVCGDALEVLETLELGFELSAHPHHMPVHDIVDSIAPPCQCPTNLAERQAELLECPNLGDLGDGFCGVATVAGRGPAKRSQ